MFGLRGVLQAPVFSGSTVGNVGVESEKHAQSGVSWMAECPGHSTASPIRTVGSRHPATYSTTHTAVVPLPLQIGSPQNFVGFVFSLNNEN